MTSVTVEPQQHTETAAAERSREGRAPLTTAQYIWRLLRYDRPLFFTNIVLWTVIRIPPLLMGMVAGWFFDALTGHHPLGLGPWAVVALMGGVALADAATFAGIPQALEDTGMVRVWPADIVGAPNGEGNPAAGRVSATRHGETG